MSIPGSWRQKAGEGVLVGVCDHTVDTSLPQLRGMGCRTFGSKRTNARHGTFVCTSILGVAPKCSLAVAHGPISSIGELGDMLEWLESRKPAVLNLSLAYEGRDSRVESILEGMLSRGCLVVCAKGAGRLDSPWKTLPCVLVAGEGGDFEAPSSRVSVGPGGGYMRLSGSSVSCALTSGLCALARACDPGISKAEFLEVADPADGVFAESLYGRKSIERRTIRI